MMNDLFACVDSETILSQEDRDAKTDKDELKHRFSNMNDMMVCSKYLTLLCEKSPELNFAQHAVDDKLATYNNDLKKEIEAPSRNNAYKFEFRLEDFLVKIKKNSEDGVKFMIMTVDKTTNSGPTDSGPIKKIVEAKKEQI